MSAQVVQLWGRRMGLLLLALIVAAAVMVRTPLDAHAYDIRKGPNPSNRVTLNFDDCPKSAAQFRSVLVAARDLDVALMLFPTGDCISSGRFDVVLARSLGHYVFNHSISHPDLTTLSYNAVRRQLGAPGVVTSYGRPPYGAINNTVRSAYSSVGMTPWLWNVDTQDWNGKTASQVVNHVVNNARAGDSVLMHMQWNGFSGTAIEAMKSGLARRGLQVCRNYPGTTPVRPTQLNCNGRASHVFGDESGDGLSDVLVVNQAGHLMMYRTRSGSPLANGVRVGHGWQVINWFARVPDLTGDGRHDLLARRNDGTLWLYPGRGKGSFGSPKQLGHGWSVMHLMTVVPDVDGDGHPELLAANTDGQLYRYRLTGTRISNLGQIGHDWRSNIVSITSVGNSSGDSTPDLLAVNSQGHLLSYTMSPSGRITRTVQLGHGWTGFSGIHSPGDMTSDGLRDLVARSPDGKLYLYRNRGGSFAARQELGHGWNVIRLFG